jgi:transposase
MPRHRSHSTGFKRQVVAKYHAGETLYALGRHHDLSRNLIRIWIEQAEAGSLDQDMASAEFLSEYEARIAALERLVARQALEFEFLRGLRKTDNRREARLHPQRAALRPLRQTGVRADGPATLHPLCRPVEQVVRGGARARRGSPRRSRVVSQFEIRRD